MIRPLHQSHASIPPALLIMQPTHAYSRADHVTAAGTPCKVIKIGKGHVIKADQCIDRT